MLPFVSTPMNLHIPRHALFVWFFAFPGAAVWAQSSPRPFYEISIGKYPGIVQLERGVSPGIASGSHTGIYIRFAEDIANLCAKYDEGGGKDRFRLNVFATQGGFDSLKRLRKEDEVQLAVVQSDLWYYAKLYGNPPEGGGRKLTVEEARIQSSWKEIYDNIRLLLPLYEEKIHILVKPDDKSSGKYKDLSDLFTKEARVNVGTQGSGILVTCTLLEEMMSGPKGVTGGKKWKPFYYDTDTALQKLTDKKEDTLDAVIIVGGVPFPALDRFSVEYIKQAKMKNLIKDLFSGDQIVPHLALLPFGNKADELMDKHSDFKGYLPAEIEVKDYPFLSNEATSIKTRAIMACLVTHAKYTTGAGKEAHKIAWVRHILFRVLSKLRANTQYGLVDDYGVPLAGDKWKEAALNLQYINKGSNGRNWQTSFGWPLHDDSLLKEMLQSWGQGLAGGSSTTVIDPDNPF